MADLKVRFGVTSPALRIPSWISVGKAKEMVDSVRTDWNIPLSLKADVAGLGQLVSGAGINDPRAWQLHKDLRSLLATQPTPLTSVGVLLCDHYGAKPGIFGMMFDPGFAFDDSPANTDVEAAPREGCAVFLRAIEASGNDFDKQSLRSTLHELGHVLNLRHAESSVNIMRSSSIPQTFESKSWTLTTEHGAMLQGIHPDNQAIWPGGNDFGDTAFQTGDDPWRQPRRHRSGLKLRIAAARPVFHYYEPIELDIEISLTGNLRKPVAIPDIVDPGYEGFQLWIEQPDGSRRTLRSPRHYCSNGETLTINPGEPFLRDISLFGQSGGYTFRRAGVHLLWAELALSATSKLTSATIEVEVLTRRHDDDARRALLTICNSRVLLYHRVQLRTGRRLQAFVDERPKDLVADGVRYAIARASKRHDQANGASSALSDEFAALAQSPLLGANQRRIAAALAGEHRPPRGPRSASVRPTTKAADAAPKKGPPTEAGPQEWRPPSGSRGTAGCRTSGLTAGWVESIAPDAADSHAASSGGAMKITELKSWIVGNAEPRYGGRYFIFLKLVADNGIEGVGECYAPTFMPDTVVRMIREVVGRHVVGMDPFRIEALWRNVHGRGYNLRPDVSLMSVMSGIEMALWDIVGKAVEKPVHELLGGLVHERLRSYTYIYPEGDETEAIYADPDRSAQRAAEYVAQGFTAVKFDPAGTYSAFDPRQPSLERLDLSETFVRKLREAVGSRADLLFGTHGQFTTSGAIRLARRLEPYDPLWFEEPTPPEMPEEMAAVARATSIPIATGERLTTKYEFARVLQTGAAAILQMNLGRVGGLLEAKKIAGMAETHYAQIAPHLYCGPIVGAANIQLAACSPNFLILESIRRWGGFHARILKNPIRWEDGYVIPPTAPGLGVELDEAVAEAHPYDGDRLHLEMADGPLG